MPQTRMLAMFIDNRSTIPFGNITNYKTYIYSIWDKKKRSNDAEKHSVFYNTHPVIVESEVFEKVQQIREQRHRQVKTGKTSLFSGVVYCADCNHTLTYSTTKYYEKRQDCFVCPTYHKDKELCGNHDIRAVVLEELVWMHMQEVILFVSRYEAHFRNIMKQEIIEQERQAENLNQFIQTISKYTELRELTPYALRELVKAIYVEAPDKSSGRRRQGIHICYDLVGFIPLDSLMANEPA